MSLSKLFQRIIWHNNTTPAINEDNLNAMSKAIDDIDDRVILIGDDVVTVIPQIQAYLEQAESIVEAVEELSQNPPYIGANGNWWVFDTALEAYKDSGVDASITVDIADITMIAVGATPYVTNTGTSTDPIFHLHIPQAKSITNVVKDGQYDDPLRDKYNIMFNDGTHTSFLVTNGVGIVSITKTSTQGLVDTYTISCSDRTEYDFTVTNGATGNGIVSITKTGTSGLVDTYTILFTNGSTTTFTVTNGQDGQGSGDMTKAVYDSTNAVADAGGIVAYVASQAGAGSLSGLSDVSLSTLANGESLVYNSTSQKWENGSVSYSSLSGKPALGTAAAKDSTNAVTSGSTDLVESGAVYSEISAETTARTNADNVFTTEISDMNNVLGAKNLLPNNAVAQTIAGLTFVINSDGSITVNGTSTAEWSERITGMTLKKGKYILSDGGASIFGSIRLQIVNQAESAVIAHTSTSHEMEFELSADTFVYVRIFWATGVTVSNLTFYPMIRLASIQDDTYVPYSMTNREMTPYVQAISNPNLLDNPWFTVNQRGATSLSTYSYGVDRWKGIYTVNASGNGLDFVNTNYIIQPLEQSVKDFLHNKTVTLSIMLSDGTIYKGTNVYKKDADVLFISAEQGGGKLNGASFSSINYSISMTALDNITVRAIKLELGSISTLATDTAPNYATELLKCQRYFYRCKFPTANTNIAACFAKANNAALGVFELPVSMRATPTFAMSDYTKFTLMYTSGLALTADPAITDDEQHRHISFDITRASLTAGRYYMLQNTAVDEYMEFSADL